MLSGSPNPVRWCPSGNPSADWGVPTRRKPRCCPTSGAQVSSLRGMSSGTATSNGRSNRLASRPCGFGPTWLRSARTARTRPSTTYTRCGGEIQCPVLLVRANRPLAPGGGLVVSAQDSERFAAEASQRHRARSRLQSLHRADRPGRHRHHRAFPASVSGLGVRVESPYLWRFRRRFPGCERSHVRSLRRSSVVIPPQGLSREPIPSSVPARRCARPRTPLPPRRACRPHRCSGGGQLYPQARTRSVIRAGGKLIF